jgi:hypothetical protein
MKPRQLVYMLFVLGAAVPLSLAACSSGSSSGGNASMHPPTQLQARFDVANLLNVDASSTKVDVFAKFTTVTGQDVKLGPGESVTCNGITLAFTASGAYNYAYTTSYYTASINRQPTSGGVYHFMYLWHGVTASVDVPTPSPLIISSPSANGKVKVGPFAVDFTPDPQSVAVMGYATDGLGDTVRGAIGQANVATSGKYTLNTGNFEPGKKGQVVIAELLQVKTPGTGFLHVAAYVVASAAISVNWVAA